MSRVKVRRASEPVEHMPAQTVARGQERMIEVAARVVLQAEAGVHDDVTRGARALQRREPGPDLDAVGVPALVVSGERDPFGVPPEAPGREVVVVPGAVHDLRRDLRVVASGAVDWLTRHGWAAA